MAILTVTQENAFLKELTALSRKHGIAVGGCGCCGSPYLHAIVAIPEAGYVDWDCVRWCAPGDWDWKEMKSKVAN